jgi:hypothetical protein
MLLCYVMLCHVMSCHFMPCHVMLCHVVMLCYVMLCYWRISPQWARASSFTKFLDHTRRTAVGRTPLDERSARRRDLYLTTRNTQHLKQTDINASRWDSKAQSQQANSHRPTRSRRVWKGENLLLPPGFKSLTEGMVPTCRGSYSLRMELPAFHTIR